MLPSADVKQMTSVLRVTGAILLFALVMGFLATEPHGFFFSPAANANYRFLPRFTIADFDGDQNPDLATIRVSRSTTGITNYSIHLQLSVGPESVIGISAPLGGLQIFSSDVNGDRTLDLVVRTLLESNLVAVLLNDGHGKFTLAEPGAFPGLEKEVEFRVGAQGRGFVERISLLPPRSSIGGESGSANRARLQVTAQPIVRRDDERTYSFLVKSSFGRSPPAVELS
jgi:hypothetical protein